MSCFSVSAQWYAETIGTPAAPSSVSAYTGWVNQNVLDYSGTALVDTANPSTNTYGSGGGNIFLTNTPGTSFQVSGFSDIPNSVSVNIQFSMYGHDTSNINSLGDLELQVSSDSGSTWTTVPYSWAYALFPTPPNVTPWDYFTADMPLPYTFHPTPNPLDDEYAYTDFSDVFVRFVQTSSTKAFRIDDLHVFPMALLSIQLLSFDALVFGRHTTVSWKAVTKSEYETFFLERSLDGKTFSSISEHKAKGKGTFSYSYQDAATASTCYYRLKLVEEGGRISSSKILTVAQKTNGSGILRTIYPNPAKDVLYLEIGSSSNQAITVAIIDLAGRQVKKVVFPATTTGIFQLSLADVTAGSYVLLVDNGAIQQEKKIVVGE